MDTKSASTTKAFTLVELLTVIAIIGVITAVSMPIYNNYIVSSRASMLFNAATEAKLAVESTFLRSPTGIGAFTVASNAAPYTTNSANFLSCVVINNGTVSVIGNPSQLGSQNIWISFVPNTANNTLEWGCYYSAAADQYLSENCQTIGACSANGAFGTAVGITSPEYFSYPSNPPTAAEYNAQCALSPPTFASCSKCYGFVNTASVQRSMSYTLLSVGPFIFSQQCMEQKAAINNCAAATVPTCF